MQIKLKHLDKWNNLRRNNAKIYNEFLSNVEGIVIPFESSFNKHIYHLYVTRLISANRKDVMEKLKTHGIASQIHYPVPLHQQKAYSYMQIPNGKFQFTDQYAQQILSLPMFPELTQEQIQYVCEKLIQIINE